jgi:hypothetical protein
MAEETLKQHKNDILGYEHITLLEREMTVADLSAPFIRLPCQRS